MASFLWIGPGQARDLSNPKPLNCCVLLPANLGTAQRPVRFSGWEGTYIPDFPFYLSLRSDALISPLSSDALFPRQT